MKLALVREWAPIAAAPILHAASLDDGTLIAVTEDRHAVFGLLHVHPEAPQIQIRPLPGLQSGDRGDRPVLLAHAMAWGLVIGGHDLRLYAGPNAEPVHVPILDPERVLPPHAHKHKASVTATPGQPAFVCLERAPTYLGQARHFAELRWNPQARTAQWQRLASIQPSADCPASPQGMPPRVEHLVSAADGALYAFVPGSQTVAAEKWGMDYWALARITPTGTVEEILLRGGNTGDGRKRGVRGSFTASADHIILAPLFANDEWKGRQHLFSISDRTLEAVVMPRGKSAYRLLQQHHARFWIFRQDAGQLFLALCRRES